MRPAVLALAAILGGCSAAPVVQTAVTPLHVPHALLMCAPDPTPPALLTDRTMADYLLALWSAGGDCRAHLAAVTKALGE